MMKLEIKIRCLRMASKQYLPVSIDEGADVGLVVEVAVVADAVRLHVEVVQGQVNHIHPGNTFSLCVT